MDCLAGAEVGFRVAPSAEMSRSTRLPPVGFESQIGLLYQMVIAMTKRPARLNLTNVGGGILTIVPPVRDADEMRGVGNRGAADGGNRGHGRVQARGYTRLLTLVFAANLAICTSLETAAAQGRSSGAKVPRFVSLKANRVNLRKGPGTDYPTSWVFRRAGLPVEIVKEFEGWRQVRDAEGTTGWVLGTLLSGRRTAQILPWEVKPSQERPHVALTSSEDESSEPVALVEAGVIADVHECDGTWCLVSVDQYRGYVLQKKLWGVYPGEIIE
jgi:SH3-like domain-containing protein